MKRPRTITLQPPKAMMTELIVLGAIEKVNLEIIVLEALGDWIKKKRAEYGRTPHQEDWDWEKPA